MCFAEFIGYTCGHMSPEVLRPCPMTTNAHTNPVCSSHGRRPILAEEMCPACQRILHGRAVLILEWEHHWMHERGVCGCPVAFPDLIRPRVVGRGRHPETTERVSKETSKEKKVSRGGKDRNKNGSKGMTPTNLTDRASTFSKTRLATHIRKQPSSLPERLSTGRGTMPSKPSARESSSMRGGNEPAEVEVRIASFYGAEWVDEHRQLHKAGSCKCAADFSLYKTPEAYRHASSPSHYEGEQGGHAAAFYSTGGRDFEGISSPAHFQGQAFSHSPRFAFESSHTYNNNNSILAHQDAMKPHYFEGLQSLQAWGQGYVRQHSQPQQYQDWRQETQPGNPYHPYQSWDEADQQQQPGNIHQGTRPLQPATFPRFAGLPKRSPGAIYQVDPTRSTNPLYNYACNEGAKIGPYADGQSVDYPRAKDAPHPLVGLPIGAGPEGPDLLSHVGKFDHCVLLRSSAPAATEKAFAITSNLKRGGGARAQAGAHPVSRDGGGGSDKKTRSARPPCSKSASVACLHELKARRNPSGGSPAWHSESAGSMVSSAAGPL